MGVETAIAASVIVPVVGGLIADHVSAGDRDRANRAAQEALDIINRTGAPPDLSKQILLEKFKSAGVLTPEMEKDIDVKVSKVSQLQENPDLAKAQLTALQTLQQRSKTGIGPEDRAALNQIRAEIQRDQEAKRQQILQNLQSRGQAGGGAEIAQLIAAQQGGANQAAMQGEQLAANASQRALQALTAGGSLAGQIRGQDFDINRTRAQAEDELNRFNVSNQLALQSRNVGARNAAQAGNLQNEQNILNANISQQNQERLRQNEAQRQYWQDQLQRAGMLSGAKMGEANLASQEAQRKAQQVGGIASGISAGIGAYGNYQQNEKLIGALSGNRAPASSSAMSVPDVQVPMTNDFRGQNDMNIGQFDSYGNPIKKSPIAPAPGGRYIK